jgi:hypothetical protein
MGLRGNLPIFVSNFLNQLLRLYVNLYVQENGVPQGSILSATLFSIKINSLAQVLKKDIEGYLFVDDFTSSFHIVQKIWQVLNGNSNFKQTITVLNS